MTNNNDEYLSIGEAAKLLEVSIDTLRRWDESGKLRAVRSAGSHRRYKKNDIEIFLSDIWDMALNWVSVKEPTELPNIFYCQTSAIFQARLTKMQTALEADSSLSEIFTLLVAITGEIGNNSFDHNLGNWPDVPGIMFAYDVNKRQIVLADRGLGILQTLKRIRPDLNSHSEALKVAFTEIISGRNPENRGNGLKFVKKVTEDYPINLFFRTGDASLTLKGSQKNLDIEPVDPIKGCLAIITY